MSRRLAVLLVVLGVAIPYCALGAVLWFSRGTGEPPRHTFFVSIISAYQSGSWRNRPEMPVVCSMGGPCVVVLHKRHAHHKDGPTVQFTVTGSGWLGKIAYSEGWPRSASRRVPLADFPSLPFHATRYIAAPHRQDRYTISAQLWRYGNLTCTVRIGRVSATAHVLGNPNRITVCRASLWWSARHGRWLAPAAR